jgi:hypothetical protein
MRKNNTGTKTNIVLVYCILHCLVEWCTMSPLDSADCYSLHITPCIHYFAMFCICQAKYIDTAPNAPHDQSIEQEQMSSIVETQCPPLFANLYVEMFLVKILVVQLRYSNFVVFFCFAIYYIFIILERFTVHCHSSYLA